MNPLWYFLYDDRIRLSRLIAVPLGLLAIVTFVYGLLAPDSAGIGTALAILFAIMTVGVWKLGNWWQLRQLLRKAQEGMPNRQRGFEVVRRNK